MVGRRRHREGEYTVETKLSIDLGIDTIRDYQQEGLIVYSHDDRYIKLIHMATCKSRRTEFAREHETIGYGSMWIRSPSDTT